MTETEPLGTVSAWGSPLKEEATELVVGKISTLTGPITDYPGAAWYTVCGSASTNANASVMANLEAAKTLKGVMKTLEEDIAYFNLLKGQALAIHKFATLKLTLSEVVELLEK